MSKILVIDDDVAVLQLLQIYLETQGFIVFTAKSGRAGLELAWEHMPNLVLLDLVMPIMDGFETYRRLRDIGIDSVIIMSHRQDERSAVKALEMGAEDYLRKPISLDILQAKIQTLFRRKNLYGGDVFSLYNDGHLHIDLDSRAVTLDGAPVKLTPTEYRLLSVLMRKVGRVVTHEEIIKDVWGADKKEGLGSLKLYIHYLRQKLEENPRKPYYVLAEWGIGYRLKEPEEVPAEQAA